jgi:hypothetical protein
LLAAERSWRVFLTRSAARPGRSRYANVLAESSARAALGRPTQPSREQQQRARIFGVLFALTFVTSPAGLLLYDPVLNDADYILGGGADTRVQLGALCEIFLAITNIGTAVVLWPIVKWQSETLALSYVASRVVESMDVPAQARLLCWCERAAARLPVLPVRPRAAVDGDVGLVGGPLIFASAIAVLFGAYEQDGAHFLFSIPEIVFEASITI